ncbi:MAG: hypothetical protein KDE55_24950, partial [Novosphingobium sp.]|nr:hypothetical protein [Novosphingobium sp.]
MDTLRVSATDIDALRYYRDSEDGDLSELLARLRREAPPTEAMLAGTALHKALETAADGTVKGFAADGFTFSFETEAEVDLPAIREMKATREYEIGGCLVTLVGKVDALHGKRIDDHKFTSRFDPERFLNSYQWRIYLDIFDADEFRWNVFEGRESASKNYLITGVHPLTMYRYPGMADDIARALRAYVEFAWHFLPERFVSPLVQNMMGADPMPTRFIETDRDRATFIRFVESQALPFSASVSRSGRRSVKQNKLQRLWLSEIAEQLGDRTPEEVRGYCKLTIGVPILRDENEDFRDKYDRIVRPLPYPQKLAIMMEPLDLPVTRLMTTKQHASYLDGIYRHFTEQGLALTDPDPFGLDQLIKESDPESPKT